MSVLYNINNRGRLKIILQIFIIIGPVENLYHEKINVTVKKYPVYIYKFNLKRQNIAVTGGLIT